MNRILPILLFSVRLSAQPVLTISHSPLIRYNDQHGPPTDSPGTNGCVGPSFNTPPCTGRWANGDTFSRTWDGATSWMTGNDTTGPQTGLDHDGTFRSLFFGAMSSDNLTWTASNFMSQFGSGGEPGIGACQTRNGSTVTNGSWKSSGLIAYHGNLYWWIHCQDWPSFAPYHSTLLKSSNGMVSYTFKNHGTPGNAIPALADMILQNDGGIVEQMWWQYANCPDNFGCPYVRLHGGDTWAYMLCGPTTRAYLMPCRISWANLEADPFNSANLFYLTFAGTQATCADGDVDLNWTNDLANALANSCHTPFGYGNTFDMFYSPDLRAFVTTNWETGVGIELDVSSTPWGPWTIYQTTDNPVYGSKFFAADLRTYQASIAGNMVTITVDVTSSGNGGGFLPSDNYSILKQTVTLTAPQQPQSAISGKATLSGNATLK